MHPSIFSVGVAPECPRQPLLFCEFNGGVQLSVLVDTGSMKSILSLDACQLISDGCIRHSENPPTFRANSSQCLSVTGRGGSRPSPHSHGRMSNFMAEKLSVINSRLHNICNVYFLI